MSAEVRSVRQQKILERARRIILTRGMKKLTTRRIARELNVTDGALYRHFKSKDDILELLIDDIEKALLSALVEASDRETDPMRRLESIFYTQAPAFVMINETLSIKDKQVQKKMAAILDKYLKTIRRILKEGIASGHFRPELCPISTSILFFGMLQSSVILQGVHSRSVLKKDRLQEIFRIYKNGISKAA